MTADKWHGDSLDHHVFFRHVDIHTLNIRLFVKSFANNEWMNNESSKWKYTEKDIFIRIAS